MSSATAIVKSIVGQVFVVSPEGVRRILVEGDHLLIGDQIDTGASGAVSLELADGRTLDLGRDTRWSATTPESSTELSQAAELAAPSVKELQQAIAAGADPTNDLEPTAAGPSAAGAGAAAGGGHTFVLLDETAGRVDPNIGFPTAGIGSTATALEDTTGRDTTAPSGKDTTAPSDNDTTNSADKDATDTPLVDSGNAADEENDNTPVAEATSSTLTLSATDTTAEGGQITYTATLTNIPYTPVIVTLSNGAQITIDAGKTTGSVTVTAPSDDVYLDAGTVNASINNATGGNYENLVINNAPAVTSVTDTLDPTTATISGSASVAEGQSASYTLSLSHPAQTEVTLQLSYSGTAADGSDFSGVYSVKIPAGATSTDFNIVTLDDNITENAANFVVKIDSASGGNFEAIVLSDTHGSVTTTIIDNDAPPALDLDTNDSSGATGADYQVTFTKGTNGPGVSIGDTDLSITDPDSTMLTGATVVLTNSQAGDSLNLGNNVNDISISTDIGSGSITLTLYGNATLADYMQQIKNITFTNNSEDPSTTPRNITVTVTDGNSYSNVATTTVNVTAANDAPMATGGAVTGTEDTALTLTWPNFGVSDVDSPAANLGVKITQLPDDGKLQYLDGGTWKDVTGNQTLSKADIDSGKLRFMPHTNESGIDGYGTTGVGNQQADYVHFQFQATDGQTLSPSGIVTIDIAQIADAPSLSLVTTPPASGTDNTGVENGSVKLAGINTGLTDTDGSESLSVKISGVPAGAVLSDGAGHTFTASPTTGEVNVTDWSLGTLTVTPAPYYNGTFDLTVTSTSTESLGGSASSTALIPVTVYPAVYNAITGTANDDNITGTSNNDVVVADIGGLHVVQGQNYNIAFMVDTSGSMSTASVNAAKDALTMVFNSLKQSLGSSTSGTVNIFLADFDSQVNKSISVNLNDPDALPQLKTVIDSMASGNYTNYEDVFKATANWFINNGNSNSNATNLTYFITDGKPTSYQTNEKTNPKLYDDVKLDDVLTSANYTLGAQGPSGAKYIVQIDSTHQLKIDSKGATTLETLVGTKWTSTVVGTVHAQGDGTFEISTSAGDGNTSSLATSNADSAFTLLSKLSQVEAIGLNNAVSLNDLKPYDSDGHPQANIDPSNLANAILGHTEASLPGSDKVTGGDGADIMFGDLVSFNGVTGEGYQALQGFVAQQTGSEVSTVTTSNVHQYITEHYTAFDVSGTHDASDNLLGENGNDIIFGEGGNDLLDGGRDNDILLGGTGNDTLIGGQGNDTLIGGSGADTFAWKTGDTGSDVIKDFKVNEGDRIDLHDLLQGESGSTIDNFLKITTVDGVSTLQVSSEGKLNDAGGTANADVTIKLEGNNWSTATVNSLIAGSDPTIKIDHNNS